jgi:HEAT repeat protein
MLWWTLRQLRSEDAIKRVEAVKQLSSSREPRAIEALVEMLDDPAGPVENEARKALIAMRRVSVEALLAALSHPSDKRKVNAASALRLIIEDWSNWDRVKDVVSALTGVIGNTDPSIRRVAVEELGFNTGPAVVKSLAIALSDKITGVRQAASGSLLRLLDAEQSKGQPAFAAGAAAQALDALPALVEAMRNHQPWEGEYEVAGRMVSRIGSQAVQPLLDLLHQASKESLRVTVIEALGLIPDPKSQQPIVDALKDRSPSMRLMAARALGKFQTPSVEYALETALKDGDINVRMAAAESLLKIIPSKRVPIVTPTLFHALRTESTAIRQKAATLLGNITDPRAATELVAALNDKEQEVRKAAEESLVKLGSGVAGQLIQSLRDKSAEVRRAAARILGRLGSQAAVDPLIEALKDPDEWVRAYAAEVLRKLGDQRIIPAFIGSLEDSNDHVRTHAAAVLGELGDQQVVRPLLRAARRSEAQHDCVAALIAIMALHSVDVDTDDLRTMAEFTTPARAAADTRSPGTKSEEEMNCSALRQLAREELARRGLKIQ